MEFGAATFGTLVTWMLWGGTMLPQPGQGAEGLLQGKEPEIG